MPALNSIPTARNLSVVRWMRGGAVPGRVAITIVAATLLGCATAAPRNVHDSCSIFDEKRGWYRAAKESERRWGTPVSVQLAIIYQESRFEAKAKPPRRRILGFIPGPRPSTAYGYAQALTSTWDGYVSETGNWSARRSSFADAADFVGWYTAKTAYAHRLAKTDAYNLYLAYHEGDGGFRRGTHKRKKWLLNTARRVSDLAARYRVQLSRCETQLARGGLFSWLR
jgi:hypothetical protein